MSRFEKTLQKPSGMKLNGLNSWEPLEHLQSSRRLNKLFNFSEGCILYLSEKYVFGYAVLEDHKIKFHRYCRTQSLFTGQIGLFQSESGLHRVEREGSYGKRRGNK